MQEWQTPLYEQVKGGTRSVERDEIDSSLNTRIPVALSPVALVTTLYLASI